MYSKLKGKLIVLVVVTILLATFVTGVVIVVNEKLSRLNRFSYHVSLVLSEIYQSLGDEQYILAQDTKAIVEDDKFKSFLRFINDRSTLNYTNTFRSSVLDSLSGTIIGEIYIYDIRGDFLMGLSNVSGTYMPVILPDGEKKADTKAYLSESLYMEVDSSKTLQSVMCIPIKDESAVVGYVKTVKKIGEDFHNRMMREDGLRFSYQYIEKEYEENTLWSSWGLRGIEPILYPYTDVRRENVVYADNSVRAVQKLPLPDGAALYFHISLPVFLLPISLTNFSFVFICTFIFMLLILLPFWWVYMSRGILRPISTLNAQALKVAGGDYTSIKRELRGDDEFANLERGFASMVEAIQDRESRLSDMNRLLFDRVEEETAKRLQNEQIMLEQKKFADMGQMINAIAHQWRQPLNGLSLVVQVMCDDFLDGDLDKKDVEENQKLAIKLIAHMSKTIDDFRKFFSSSKEVVVFDVVEAVSEIIMMVCTQMNSNNISLNFSCSCPQKKYACRDVVPEPECNMSMNYISGVPGEFKQAVLNLIQNARDSIEERRSIDPAERGEIDLMLSCMEDKVVITVKDNGTGIPEDILHDVFNPYFTTKEEGKGTGIGLYMTRLVVKDNLKGSITCRNHENGAIFEIVVPKVQGGDQNA